jgi:TatD DNase family protein
MIDSHCHLDHEPLFQDLENVIKRSKEIGLEKILTICTTLDSFTNILKIIEKDPMIYGTFGIHPHEAKDNIVDTDQIINHVKLSNKIIGIGETGLDFFYNHSDRDQQIKSFEEHIQASIKLNMPLIIHSRDAEDETYQILKNHEKDNLKILMHCFTGSKKFADKLLELNSYFSASGIITFKNAIDLQETFKTIPLDKLLIETDSPFLAPVPNRGKKNEPSFIKYTAEKLAEIKDVSFSEISSRTTNNFNNLFIN